jgi:hypothetical protein
MVSKQDIEIDQNNSKINMLSDSNR